MLVFSRMSAIAAAYQGACSCHTTCLRVFGAGRRNSPRLTSAVRSRFILPGGAPMRFQNLTPSAASS